MLQPYGSLFFAAAPAFETSLPTVTKESRRLRSSSCACAAAASCGTTVLDVLRRYATGLAAVDSKLVIESTNERIDEQLAVAGIIDLVGEQNVYRGDERVGATLRRAHEDAVAWIDHQPSEES